LLDCPGRDKAARAYLADRFGVAPDALGAHRFIERRDEIWVTTAALDPDVQRVRPPGLRALRIEPRGYKPTSTLLRLLGSTIRRNRIDLDRIALRQLMLGRALPTCCSDGYIALVYDGIVIGCGRASRGQLRCMLPTAQRKALLEALPER
jgi:NOL1/NOP2/fmu family ribosome biogenesis protein